MIDLTGHSPGLLYALGASSTGSAWIYGNFTKTSKNANRVATEILNSVKCDELARAWLLVEPNGPVSISPDVLKAFGADFNYDYKAVGSFLTKPTVGGFRKIRTQIIYMPVRTSTQANKQCSDLRGL